MSRIAIIGTGLIGTSIALRLKQSKETAGFEIVGVDRIRDHARDAEKTGVFDSVSGRAREAVRGAALVILATPILAVGELMEELGDALEEGATVTDTASTKAQVMSWAEQHLPPGVSFIGGHPMAGKTEFGPKAGEAALFEGARWVVIPSPRADEAAINLVLGMVHLMGAQAMLMDAAEHDAYVAAVSHMPQLASSAVFKLARRSEAWPELSMLAAGGFRDVARLAGTDERMAHDIAVTNREQIVHWLDRYMQELRGLRTMLADEGQEEDLFRYLAEANIDHTAFEQGSAGRQEVDAGAVPEFGVMDMMMGSMLADRARDIERRMESRERDDLEARKRR